jgi:hypothetical protein
MLKDIESLNKAFQATAAESDKECKLELKNLQTFMLETGNVWRNHLANFEEVTVDKERWGNSLICWCFFESMPSCGQILYLSQHGLYISAFDSIRHMLESVVMAFYLDLRYKGTQHNY